MGPRYRIKYEDGDWFVTKDGIRVSSFLETERQAIDYRDKLVEYVRDGIIKSHDQNKRERQNETSN